MEKHNFHVSFLITAGLIMLVALYSATGIFKIPNPPIQSAAQLTPVPANFRLAGVPSDTATGTFSIIDTSTKTELARLTFGSNLYFMAMSGDGRYAYVGTKSAGVSPPAIYQVDLRSRSVVGSLILPATSSSELSDLEISPNSRILGAVDVAKGVLHVIDVPALSLRDSVELCKSCGTGTTTLFSNVSLNFSPDSSLIYGANPVDSELDIYEVSSRRLERMVGPYSSHFGVSYLDLKRFTRFPQSGRHNLYLLAKGPFEKTSPGQTVWEYSIKNIDDKQISAYLFFPDSPSGIPKGNPTDIELARFTPAGSSTPGVFVLAGNRDNSNSDLDEIYAADMGQWQNGRETSIESSENANSLTLDSLRLKLYSTCITLGEFCNPARIDKYDLRSFHRENTFYLPGEDLTLTKERPSMFFQELLYQPLDQGVVAVIDTRNGSTSATIPVGQNPRVIKMQGDTSPKGLYF